MSTKIVAHFIAGFPDAAGSMEVARGLAEGGASYLEMQIPFSDPSADGPAIENSCRQALEKNFTVDQALEQLKNLNEELKIPIFLMSYGNIVFTRGMEDFVVHSKKVGAAGLIIPDLVLGRDEGLYALGKKYDMPILPVITPSISKERLGDILALKQEWIYTALRSGITGSATTLDESNLSLLDHLKTSDSKVMAGFGIRTAQQVKTLAPRCDAVVAGSVFVNAVTQALQKGSSLKDAARSTMEMLLQ
jgi:tryptophan synthase alpha chain